MAMLAHLQLYYQWFEGQVPLSTRVELAMKGQGDVNSELCEVAAFWLVENFPNIVAIEDLFAVKSQAVPEDVVPQRTYHGAHESPINRLKELADSRPIAGASYVHLAGFGSLLGRKGLEVALWSKGLELETELRSLGEWDDFSRETGYELNASAPNVANKVMGVALWDVALVLEAGDADAAKATVNYWSASKRISAKPLGKCPVDGRRQLYKLPEILADITKILSLQPTEKSRLDKGLRLRLRLPASEVD